MSAIHLTDVIRCSSEDPTHPSTNLLKGSASQDYWACSTTNKESSIEVELQFSKEAVISFIDIANYGSQTVDILVSHSTRCRDEFVCLVPTFNFMSVLESKQRINTTSVSMFKSDDMMSDSKSHTWDRLKLVCRQPYANGKQFGLSFICLKMIPKVVQQSPRSMEDRNQNKLNNFFDNLRNESPNARKPKSLLSNPYSPKLGLLKSPNLKENQSPRSPTDQMSSVERTPKRVLSAAAIKLFREEVSCFLEDVNFKELMKTRTIKVSDLRSQIEKQRGLALVRQQKLLFMEIITERLKAIKQSNAEVNGKLVASPMVATPLKSSAKLSSVDLDVECKKCRAKLPKSVIAIHSKMCVPSTPVRTQSTNPSTPRNRNQLCFDLGDDIDTESPRKRTKLNNKSPPSSSEVIASTENGKENKSQESNVTVANGTNEVKDKLCSLLTKDYSNPEEVSKTALHVPNTNFSDSKNDDELMIVGENKASRTNDIRSPGYSTIIPDNPITVDEPEQETGECPICFLHIPVSLLVTHASNCEGRMEHDGNDNSTDLPEISWNKDAGVKTESVLCPICQKLFPKERIDVHVNVCLDTST